MLFEGAQGTLLDIDHGTYPFVTSSNPIAGGACAGAGVGPTRIDQVWGVAKAYTTRVGEGPFPTELDDEVGATMCEGGHEFGTTTGRERRCGWLDLVALRYAVRINGITHLAITKLDVLSGLPALKVCTRYRAGRRVLDEFPYPRPTSTTPRRSTRSCPAGTRTSATARSWQDLPEEARDYVQYIATSRRPGEVHRRRARRATRRSSCRARSGAAARSEAKPGDGRREARAVRGAAVRAARAPVYRTYFRSSRSLPRRPAT